MSIRRVIIKHRGNVTVNFLLHGAGFEPATFSTKTDAQPTELSML